MGNAPLQPSGRKTTRELFELLCSLKNEVNYIQDPTGRRLIAFLAERFGYQSQPPVLEKVNELERLGYISKEFSGKRLFRIKLLVNNWDDIEVAEIPKEKKKKPKKEKERFFAILMDFKNLEDGLKRQATLERFKDFSWLLDPILQKGKIIFASVFIPEHYTSRAPIYQLSNIHNFQVIVCPRQISGAVTKDADTVDAKMIDLGRSLIDYSDITDLVIISGDADFSRLANVARWRQKRAWILSASSALSGRFLEMESAQSVEIKTI